MLDVGQGLPDVVQCVLDVVQALPDVGQQVAEGREWPQVVARGLPGDAGGDGDVAGRLGPCRAEGGVAVDSA